jgi:4-hydroxyphenylpyruvate dioxygenase-like putative hemolysin
MEGSGVSDEPHITYFNMGAWPIFVGFTQSRKAFNKEMKRLGNKDVRFLASNHASATTHILEKDGTTACIIALGDVKGRSPEQIAGLIAHEAVHVAQELWANVGEREPGKEAEAYLVQQIVQECLQIVNESGKVRSTTP